MLVVEREAAVRHLDNPPDAEAEQAAQRRVEAAERAAQEKIQNASSATGDAQKNTNQLRQQLTSLETTYQKSMKAARGRITDLRKEREAICGELRRQLGSLLASICLSS